MCQFNKIIKHQSISIPLEQTQPSSPTTNHQQQQPQPQTSNVSASASASPPQMPAEFNSYHIIFQCLACLALVVDFYNRLMQLKFHNY
jgi:hypothetical protein